MTIYSMLSGGDWRDASTAETDMLVSFINSFFGVGGDIFIGVGDYKQYDTVAFRTRISGLAKWIQGNHDNSVDKWTGLYDFHGIQLLSGGIESSISILDQLDETKPSMYFQHVNFVDACAGKHSDQSNSAMAKALKAKKGLIGAACGHNHNYATFFGTDRVFMQSGTQPNIRYCGPAGWYFGYWEFDDSVSGKLTVRYYRVTVANTFVKPGIPDWEFTVDFVSGGNGGGVIEVCVNCDLNKNYCLVGQCIPKNYVLYGGIGFVGLIILIKVLKSRK